MRLITEFELWSLSKYLVRTRLVGYDSPKERESVIPISKLLWTKWYGYNRSQKLSLMLKLSAITRTLGISTSVSLRYFKYYSVGKIGLDIVEIEYKIERLDRTSR